jgi:hypothetical protein
MKVCLLCQLFLRESELFPRLPHCLAEGYTGISLHETDIPKIKTFLLETISIRITASRRRSNAGKPNAIEEKEE